MKRGVRKDGIHTLNDIKDRCYIDEAGCWVWRGNFWKNTPKCQISDPALTAKPAVLNVRRVALKLSGKRVYDSHVVYRSLSCDNDKCVNPAHLISSTRAAMTQLTNKRFGITAEKRLQLDKARMSQILPLEKVQAIEADVDAGLTPIQIYTKHQVAPTTERMIRRKRHYHQRKTVRGASVFNMDYGPMRINRKEDIAL